jgi:peptidoglycan/LPS O-acetylase OafA/YrhL
MAFRLPAVTPYAIWLVTLYAVVGSHLYLDRFSRAVSTILASAPALFLGKMSYSIYLSHMLVIVFMLTMINYFAPNQAPLATAIVLLVGVFLFTILISMISYQVVERPFQKIGKRITAKERQ